MAIELTTNFNVNTKLPIDSRTSVNTLADLVAIPNTYPGLMVYVSELKEFFYATDDGNTWSRLVDGNLVRFKIYPNEQFSTSVLFSCGALLNKSGTLTLTKTDNDNFIIYTGTLRSTVDLPYVAGYVDSRLTIVIDGTVYEFARTFTSYDAPNYIFSITLLGVHLESYVYGNVDGGSFE